jgi:hypothetical protein
MRRLPTGVLLFRVKVLSPRANLSPGGLAGARYFRSAGTWAALCAGLTKARGGPRLLRVF